MLNIDKMSPFPLKIFISAIYENTLVGVIQV